MKKSIHVSAQEKFVIEVLKERLERKARFEIENKRREARIREDVKKD